MLFDDFAMFLMCISKHVSTFQNRMEETSVYPFLAVLRIYRIILTKLDLWRSESFQIKLNSAKGWMYRAVSAKGRSDSIGKIPICTCFILFFWQRTETMLKAKPLYRFEHLATVVQAFRMFFANFEIAHLRFRTFSPTISIIRLKSEQMINRRHTHIAQKKPNKSDTRTRSKSRDLSPHIDMAAMHTGTTETSLITEVTHNPLPD